jgi:hypothetical protein
VAAARIDQRCLCGLGEMESFVVVVTWIRARVAKRAEEEAREASRHCTGCRTSIVGTSNEQLRASGGVLLEGVGWFCSARCERQYRLRFRIQQPGAAPIARSQTPVPRSSTPAETSAEGEPEAGAPKRRSAQQELEAALLARRQKYWSGV